MAPSLTYRYLIRPYWQRVLCDRATIAFLVGIPASAALTYRLPFDTRAEIVRSFIAVAEPLLVALFAIVVAAFTVFASLSTDELRLRLRSRYEYLSSFFFWTMGSTLCSTSFGLVLYLLSYSPELERTDCYFWLCCIGLALLLYCFVQVLDTGRTVALQAVGLHRLAVSRLNRMSEVSTSCSGE